MSLLDRGCQAHGIHIPRQIYPALFIVSSSANRSRYRWRRRGRGRTSCVSLVLLPLYVTRKSFTCYIATYLDPNLGPGDLIFFVDHALEWVALKKVYNMISVRGDAVVIEYDTLAMDAALSNDPRMSQVHRCPAFCFLC